MWLNPQETADLVTFTEEIHNGKLHVLCSKYKDFKSISTLKMSGFLIWEVIYSPKLEIKILKIRRLK